MLVAGGVEAVVHYAIDLAHAAEPRVAATVSSPEKAEIGRRAGADPVVHYREPGAVDALRAVSPRMDGILEVALGANLDLDPALTGPGTAITI